MVRMFLEACSNEVHVRTSAPPVQCPCFYGIDFPSRAELIATGLGVEGICRSIDADSLGYLSIDGMISASRQAESKLCTACFTGDYPIGLPQGRSGGLRLESGTG